ncbi:MAG: hypothetical protein CL678_14520 [Bdellovibrionaceae bacterium]|nr:hypothetical protein [Pseudobdellovibrionaceae bacterium]
MPGITVVGLDSAGGTQLGGGQSFVKVNGAIVVVLGDGVAGHGKSPHAGPTMVQGSSFVKINGIPVVRAGHAASCGHSASGRPAVSLSD